MSSSSSSSSGAVSRPQPGLAVRALLSTDRNVTRLAKLLTTTANLDTFLLTVTYTLHLVHAGLAKAATARLNKAADELLTSLSAKASDALLPGETLIATIEQSPSSRLVRAEQSSKALTGLIDDFRMFLRLRGLLSIWTWGASVLRSPNPDPLLHAVAVTQVLACVAFQGLENVAYLALKGVIALEPKKVGRAFIWSARMWAVHVALEFVRLGRTRQLRRRQEEQETGEKGAKITKAEAEAWWRDLYVNAAWMPLTIHWSLEQGFAGESLIALLSGFAGWTRLRQVWKATA